MEFLVNDYNPKEHLRALLSMSSKFTYCEFKERTEENGAYHAAVTSDCTDIKR